MLRNCVHMHATGGDSVCLCTERSYQSYDMQLEHNGVQETNRIFLQSQAHHLRMHDSIP